jgi:hypothetical protein
MSNENSRKLNQSDPSQNQNGWRNRIVGSGGMRAGDFLANPHNWRIHPKNQQDGLAGVLDTVGWVQEVIVNQRTGFLVDGHLRVTLALRKGEDTPVPVKYVDLSEEEEALILAALDPIAAMAATDRAKLDEVMRMANSDDQRVQAMMAEIAAKEGIIPPDFQPVGIDEQGRLDQKAKVTCPECGCEFTP